MLRVLELLLFLYPSAPEDWRKVRMNKTGKPLVMVVDAQGGGLGKQLISNIKREIDDVCLIAIGTNTVATASMLKAGASGVPCLFMHLILSASV